MYISSLFFVLFFCSICNFINLRKSISSFFCLVTTNADANRQRRFSSNLKRFHAFPRNTVVFSIIKEAEILYLFRHISNRLSQIKEYLSLFQLNRENSDGRQFWVNLNVLLIVSNIFLVSTKAAKIKWGFVFVFRISYLKIDDLIERSESIYFDLLCETKIFIPPCKSPLTNQIEIISVNISLDN